MRRASWQVPEASFYTLRAGVGPVIDHVLFAATFLFESVHGLPFLMGPRFYFTFYWASQAENRIQSYNNDQLNLTNLPYHSNSFTIMIKSCLPVLWARSDAIREFFFLFDKKKNENVIIISI